MEAWRSTPGFSGSGATAGVAIFGAGAAFAGAGAGLAFFAGGAAFLAGGAFFLACGAAFGLAFVGLGSLEAFAFSSAASTLSGPPSCATACYAVSVFSTCALACPSSISDYCCTAIRGSCFALAALFPCLATAASSSAYEPDPPYVDAFSSVTC